MMKKIKTSKELELDIYKETLDNGLEIYLVPVKNKDKYYITYATKFGSVNTTFADGISKSEVTVPDGIAHFLEHKMFEQEDGVDPFTFFAKSGTDANAYTDFTTTKYIATGTKNFKENLKYLIKYVNEPYFTDENVEKEKGIIAQEINMYKDNPSSSIEDAIRRNTYNVDNHRIDIAGEVSDIEKITKEDLYLCYNNFYNPRNMYLLIVGNFLIEDVNDVIEECLVPLTNKTDGFSIEREIEEDEKIVKDYEVIPFNVSIPKLIMSIKTSRKKFKIKDDIKLDLYLTLILIIVFGNGSLFRERVTNNNLISKFFTDIEQVPNYRTLYLYAESTQPDELIEEIKNEIKNIKVDEEDLERYKKVLIANEIREADYVDSLTYTLSSEIDKYNKVINDPIEVYKSLSIEELQSVLDKINFDNNATVVYVPKDMPSYKDI